MSPTMFAIFVSAATIGVVATASLAGYAIGLVILGAWDRLQDIRDRRRIRRLATQAVEASLTHGGDVIAGALIIIGGAYAIGGGLWADALHAAALAQ